MNRAALASVIFVVACGDDAAKGDAAPPVVDIDNGTCGDQLRFTGELVDWDSTETQFCGVFGATVQVQPTGAMHTTPPNGRLDLCIPATDPTTRVLVTPSADPSQCAGSTYPIPAVLVANRDVIRAGAAYSARMFTAMRETSLFTQIGATFDPAKAQLLVFVAGTPRAVAIAAAHATTQAYAAATGTWSAGATGIYVFFPNVDPAGGTTMLIVDGGALGAGTVPLVAGQLAAINVYAM